MPLNEPRAPLNGLGLARLQASAQTVENENEGSPEHASLGPRALSSVNQATPTEWALSASGKPTAEASRSEASLGLDWSGVDVSPRSATISLFGRLQSSLQSMFRPNKTSAEPIGERPSFRTGYDTPPGIVEKNLLELTPVRSQDRSVNQTCDDSTAAKLLEKLSTAIARCATYTECVRVLRKAALEIEPESLATAFKKTYPFLTLAPNGDTYTQIVSHMLRQKLYVWVDKLRKHQLKLADYCDTSDATSLKRGENRMRSIKFIAALPQNCNDWLRVALLSETQITGEEELTEKSKQTKGDKLTDLTAAQDELFRKLCFTKTNELKSLRMELDNFDRNAAYVGQQAIVCLIRESFPTLKLPDDADLATILNELKAYHERSGRLSENTLKAFRPEMHTVNNFYKKIGEEWNISAYVTSILTHAKDIPDFGPTSLSKMIKLQNPDLRPPSRTSTSFKDIFSYLLRNRLLQKIQTSPPLALKMRGQKADIHTHWAEGGSPEQNRSEWIKLILNAEPDSIWATAALLSDKQLIGEEEATTYSEREITDKMHRLRKSLRDLMPEVWAPDNHLSDELLNRIDKFDKDAANFGLQWMIARIKTRHPAIDLRKNADANEILAAVRRHYERSKQRPLQREKALLEALRDTIRSRADFGDCLLVLKRGQEHFTDVTRETLLQQFKLDYPKLRPRLGDISEIVSLMLRDELGLEFKGQGPAANEWQRSDRCRISEPLFSEGRDDNRRIFFHILSTLEPASDWLAMAMLSNDQLTGQEEYSGNETELALRKKMQQLRKEKEALIHKILEPQEYSADDLLERMNKFDQDANGLGLQWIIETISEHIPEIDLPLRSDTQQILDTVHLLHARRPQAETSASRQPGAKASDSARTERQGRVLLEPES